MKIKEEHDIKPQKVRLDETANGLDARCPYAVADWLGFMLDDDAGIPLKDLLRDTPWDLEDLRRFAAEAPWFVELFEKAERTLGGPVEQSENNMVSKMGKREDNTSPVVTRKLTPAEQQRNKKMSVRRVGDESKAFIQVVEDGDGNEKIDGVIKKDLSKEDAEDDKHARMMEATGCIDFTVGRNQLFCMAEPLFSKKKSLKEIEIEINAFGLMLRQYHPGDAIEGSLCAQAQMCQQMGASLLAKAVIQTDRDWANTNYNAASKFLARSQEAFKTLINYRRGGQQKMVVEHVNVEAGGQAIVGNVGLPEGGGRVKQKNGGITS